MLWYILYLVLYLFLIYKTGVFGLAGKDPLSPRVFSIVFFYKALAVPVFYLVYKKAYGGVEGFDAGKFYHDAAVISDYASSDLSGYLKLLFGLQDELPGSALYDHCLINTYNWDNGNLPDFFYNDNRIVIRLHSLFHFIAFNSYFVHALFNCLLGFTGIIALYKSLRGWFEGKEIWLLLILCFFPTLWFYSGAVLKEGIALFVMGNTAWQLKKLSLRQSTFPGLVFLTALLTFSVLLKPYLLIPSVISFFLLFFIQQLPFKQKTILFFSSLLVLLVLVNGLTLLVKQKSLITIASDHQRLFADAAMGGIFLLDDTKFVRLEYDYKLVKKTEGKDSTYHIRSGVPFVYWEHSHQQDTLYTKYNTDTITAYKLVYDVPHSGSNIRHVNYGGNLLTAAGSYFYYSLFFPFFANAKGVLQWMASLENFAILISLILILWGLIRNKQPALPVVVWLSLALGLCLLIGATTPNSGAIFRYRSPVVVFILMSALYYRVSPKTSFQKRS